jgi:transposase
MFPNLQAQTALAFILEFPTPAAATKLTAVDFEAFLAAHHYSRRKYATARLAVLQQPALQTEDSTVNAYQGCTTRLATLLLQTVQLKTTTQKELTSLFEQHPDHDIFASLPGTGALLAPALLSKFGDDRQRFSAPAAIQALAGTCPITQQSGKHRSVHFRQACDHDFRNYAHQWAIASVNAAHSPFACAYYESLRQRHIDENHAYRCLANRWLAIAWRLWHSHRTYDEAYHLLQRAQRSQPVSPLLA